MVHVSHPEGQTRQDDHAEGLTESDLAEAEHPGHEPVFGCRPHLKLTTELSSAQSQTPVYPFAFPDKSISPATSR
jgi:hypothetical protein